MSLITKIFPQKVKILEVEKGTKLPEMTPELRESLKTLVYHPGFQYLINRFRLQRAQVQGYINEGFKLDDNELRFAQAGMYWLQFLESEFNRLTFTPQVTREALVDERAEFNRISQSLETIGAD